MDYGLKGKTAFITGAAQGIGRTIARVLSGYGCNLCIADINTEKLEKTKAEIEESGVNVLPLRLDVTDSQQIETCAAEAALQSNGIDILVNNAGISHACILTELSEKDWDKVMDINAKSVFLVTKAVANKMIEFGRGGKIINISSQASKLGEYGNGVYSCAKALVNMLTQVYALELAGYGINVNAICPGYVNTEIMQKVFRERGPLEGMTPKQYEDTLLRRVPLGRMIEPSEIGEFIAFLASNKSDYITGVSYTIAGGSTMI
jgi:NAD(P)-dependent dehydrogenase (short-subunit alcohol dehydrogenase family)